MVYDVTFFQPQYPSTCAIHTLYSECQTAFVWYRYISKSMACFTRRCHVGVRRAILSIAKRGRRAGKFSDYCSRCMRHSKDTPRYMTWIRPKKYLCFRKSCACLKVAWLNIFIDCQVFTIILTLLVLHWHLWNLLLKATQSKQIGDNWYKY